MSAIGSGCPTSVAGRKAQVLEQGGLLQRQAAFPMPDKEIPAANPFELTATKALPPIKVGLDQCHP